MPRYALSYVAALLLCGVPYAARNSAQTQPALGSGPQILVPNPDVGADTMQIRKQAQMATMDQFKVFHQFHFVDRVKESGIDFHFTPTADQLNKMKADHYDHGSGIAVADVDGDGLYDILFLNHVGGNELWKNLGNGKFRDITKESGVALSGLVSVGASFADIDNDGDQDLFITTVRGGDFLFENDGHGHFTDITKQSGIDIVAHSAGAVFFDYDRDGLVDLLICNVGRFTTDQKEADGAYVGFEDAFSGYLHPDRFEHVVLYKNIGNNKFKDVTADVGLQPSSWTGDASFVDLNGDGYPGLYLLNMHGDNHYYENEGGRKFVEKTAQYFPKTPPGAMGIKFFDFDNDGRMDLYVTDMHSDMRAEATPFQEKLKSDALFPDVYPAGKNTSIFGNAFYHNLGDGKFEEISDRLGVETYWPWGVSVGDVNADGWEDIFVTGGMGCPFRYGINSMLLNNRGEKFLDSEFLLGIEPRRDNRTHAPSFMLDCSQPQSGPPGNFCTGRSGHFEMRCTLSSRSSVMFDLDNDGDLDIVTNEYDSEPMVLISDLAQVKKIHWLKILLRGTKSNRDGLGATVRLHAGNQTYTRYNDGKSGYLSQSTLPLYFGLGDATKIDRIEVTWPSGIKQVVTKGLNLNRTLEIREPK